MKATRIPGPVSVVGVATGYGLDIPGIESRWGARFSAPVQTGPGTQQASCTMGTGSFPGVKSGRSVTLTPHSLLVPSSWKGRAISLLPLWAVRLVQSLSACTRVHFTFLPLPAYRNSQIHWQNLKRNKIGERRKRSGTIKFTFLIAHSLIIFFFFLVCFTYRFTSLLYTRKWQQVRRLIFYFLHKLLFFIMFVCNCSSYP